MKYISTRGKDSPIGFEDALLSGLARDGGLYLPRTWPRLDDATFRALKGKPYAEVAARIMAEFTDGEISLEEMMALTTDTYAGFAHPEVAPLVEIDGNIHVCELFHGPTIAFKDYAMQFLSRAFDRALKARGKRAVILGATSGDTGSAALEAFQGRDFVDIFILFPDGRVSPIQQRQMTSVIADGAHAIAVEGDFDACQDAVKALFRDLEFRDRMGLSAINSINWARLMPQIVYYVTSALALGAPEREIAFAVPTGNFGNIFAGYVAQEMGLPIKTLICASNRNDILARFFTSGRMERREVEPSFSPSMDIQISSNFERLLFELLERDGEAVSAQMQRFSERGEFDVSQDVLARARKLFHPFRLDDAGTLQEIERSYKATGMVLDPHSAIGVAAARAARADDTIPADTPIVALACAHPAKFPAVVEKAIGLSPALPPHLADLMDRDERMHHVRSEPAAIAALLEAERRL
ncbi:threonine synthase [Alphaproteobacteria bacterium LSUCC0684]